MSSPFRVTVRSTGFCGRFEFETFGGAVAYLRHMWDRSDKVDFDCLIDGRTGRHTLDELLLLFQLPEV